ncbi:type II toxin-antitoxin system Phd/YefM family antitoxin [Argonema galeatum]|uniref:type II toxin-antitoxin system Phd/YefM family antitoxin n=1 Tax=Argonema galeatum TaxID=2942762 RepID=UPI0020124484|nr:toxin-antitoxin (TA) system antitoxin [Argonema galeatum]MCL1466991.1 toxin-antitoxin (TA) system antitoxin [Argonema galeatum A003/A1]
MLTKTFDIQQNSISLIDFLALVEDNTEIVLTNGDMPFAKVIPINYIQEKIAPKAGLNLGAMVMSDDFDEPLPDEFWAQ